MSPLTARQKSLWLSHPPVWDFERYNEEMLFLLVRSYMRKIRKNMPDIISRQSCICLFLKQLGIHPFTQKIICQQFQNMYKDDKHLTSLGLRVDFKSATVIPMNRKPFVTSLAKSTYGIEKTDPLFHFRKN